MDAVVKHLNSPLFRKRYLTEEQVTPETSQTPETPNGAADCPAQTDKIDAVAPVADSKDEGSVLPNGNAQSTSNGENDEHKEESTIDGKDNAEVEKAVVPDINVIPTENETELQSGQIGNEAEKATSPDQGDVTDDEDNASINDARSVTSEDRNDVEEADTDRSNRYEIIHWPQHLQEAEALWSSDEKKDNPLWKELWDLVLKFFCDSPGTFRAWQLRYRQLPEQIWGVKDDEILTPLQVAAAYGLTGLCEMLIQRGESAAAVTSSGCSALWFAASYDIELLRLLLLNGADPNHFTETLPPFYNLLYLGQPIEKIKLLIDFKADPDLHAQWEMTSIHWCGGWCSDPEILRLLLANGADINAPDEMGETGLHKLMWQYDTPKDLLEEFLKAGANVNIEDKEGQQPLYEVCSQGSEDGCRMLLEHGADVEHADTYGITAMHAAATNGSYDCEKLLIEWKASLTRTDKHSRTPFWHACSNGYRDSAKLIMDAAHEQGCDEIVTMAADDGRTPLSKACGRQVSFSSFVIHY